MGINSKTMDRLFKVGMRDLMDARGWNQTDLSIKSGVHRGTINYLYQDSRPAKVEHQWAIAETFGMTPEQVMAHGLSLENGVRVEGAPAPPLPPRRDKVAFIIDQAISAIEEQELFPGRQRVADWIAAAIVDWIAEGQK